MLFTSSMKIEKPPSPLETQTGEYIPASVSNSPPLAARPKRRWWLGGLFSPFIWILVVVILVFVTLMFGRQWYDSLLVRLDQNRVVHPDQSIVKTGIHPQVRPTVTLIYKNQEGERIRVLADAQEYSEFVNQQVANLEQARQKLLTQTEKQLRKVLTGVFDGMRERVERFADWYFAYTTTYKILWEATTSATKHVFSAEVTSLTDAVAYDVEKYLHKHYENIVLRPEITDPKLRSAYNQVLQTIHAGYVKVLSSQQAHFQAFVSKYTTHLEIPAIENAEMVLDWESQFNKINMADYEKGPKGAALGATLIAGGAAIGKTVGGSVATKTMAGTAGKAMAATASKGLLAKLSAPFVSKAVLAGTGGAIGTLGGPLGTALGAISGLGVDYALNEGMELTQRDIFVSDVHEALKITQNEWEKDLLSSLQEAVNIWINDTIQLLPRYKP